MYANIRFLFLFCKPFPFFMHFCSKMLSTSTDKKQFICKFMYISVVPITPISLLFHFLITP